MAVLPSFEPMAQPGALQRNALSLLSERQSMMDRATAARQQQELFALNKQKVQQEMEMNRVLLPLKAKEQYYEAAKAYAGLKSTQSTVEMLTEFNAQSPAAEKEWENIMRMDDAMEQARAASNWTGKYMRYAALKDFQPLWEERTQIAGKFLDHALRVKAADEKTKELTSPVGKLLNDLNWAQKNRPQDVNYIKAALQQELTPKGMTLETRPDGTFILAQGVGGLTTPNTTKSQERQYQQERLVKEGAKLLGILRPEDLGVQGVVRENVGGLLGQIDPTLAEENVAENRMRLRAYRESALRAVSDDSRFSDRDRTAIERMFPSDNWVENLPQAQAKLRAAITLFSQRAKDESARRGEKSLADLSPEELVTMARENKVDKQVAAALLDALHADWLKQQTTK